MRQINTNRFLYDAIRPYAQGKKTLDIGCGDGAYSSLSEDTVRLDRDEKFKPDVALDLRTSALPFKDDEFECILILDALQHLSRNRAREILRQAKAVTSGRIYVLVPLRNEMDANRSSWSPGDFKGWTRIDFGNYFFGYWDFDPSKVEEISDMEPDPPEPEVEVSTTNPDEDSKGAEIRSPFGYNTDWDY